MTKLSQTTQFLVRAGVKEMGDLTEQALTHLDGHNPQFDTSFLLNAIPRRIRGNLPIYELGQAWAIIAQSTEIFFDRIFKMGATFSERVAQEIDNRVDVLRRKGNPHAALSTMLQDRIAFYDTGDNFFDESDESRRLARIEYERFVNDLDHAASIIIDRPADIPDFGYSTNILEALRYLSSSNNHEKRQMHKERHKRHPREYRELTDNDLHILRDGLAGPYFRRTALVHSDRNLHRLCNAYNHNFADLSERFDIPPSPSGLRMIVDIYDNGKYKCVDVHDPPTDFPALGKMYESSPFREVHAAAQYTTATV